MVPVSNVATMMMAVISRQHQSLVVASASMYVLAAVPALISGDGLWYRTIINNGLTNIEVEGIDIVECSGDQYHSNGA